MLLTLRYFFSHWLQGGEMPVSYYIAAFYSVCVNLAISWGGLKLLTSDGLGDAFGVLIALGVVVLGVYGALSVLLFHYHELIRTLYLVYTVTIVGGLAMILGPFSLLLMIIMPESIVPILGGVAMLGSVPLAAMIQNNTYTYSLETQEPSEPNGSPDTPPNTPYSPNKND